MTVICFWKLKDKTGRLFLIFKEIKRKFSYTYGNFSSTKILLMH